MIELHPVRHADCNQRLFDAAYEVYPVHDGNVDLALRCSRCKEVVKFIFELPRSEPLGQPLPILCGNAFCGHRLLDVSLQYELLDSGGDIAIKCSRHRCGYITHIRFSGVLGEQ